MSDPSGGANQPPPVKPTWLRGLGVFGLKAKSETDHQRHERIIAEWTRRLGYLTVVLATTSVVTTCVLHSTDVTLKDTMIVGQRAYVGPVKDPLIVEATRSLFTLENYGQTPAMAVNFFSNWEFMPVGTLQLPSDFKFQRKATCRPNLYGAALYPKKELISQRLHCPDEIVSLSKVGKELNAFFYGEVEYFDVFREKRRTNFCLLYNGSSAGVWCDRYNELDPSK